MRYSARTLVCLLGVSSIALLPIVACSSASTPTTDEDAGHDATTSQPDTGVDSGTTKDTGTKKDTGVDAAKDATKGDAKEGDAKEGDAKTGDAKEGDAKEGDAKEGDAHEGDAHEGDAVADAHDAAHDGPTDATTDAKDAATDAKDAAAGPTTLNYLMGRWDTSAVIAANVTNQSYIGAVAEWAGTGILTTFTGANISVELMETCNSTTDNQCDTVSIEIDGVLQTTATVNTVSKTPTGNVGNFQLITGMNTITVSGLNATATHTIGVYKNTDYIYGGKYSFVAFVPAAAGTNPKAAYTFAHHIEWLGDDGTAGSGVLGTDTYCTASGLAVSNSDEYDSYPRIVSEYFNAEHTNLGVSNVGVYMSDPPTTALFGALYPLTLPDEATKPWPFTAFSPSATVPDLVVVNIGGNGDFDFITGDNGAAVPTITPAGFAAGYEGGLETLLSAVRSKYAAAFILVTLGQEFPGALTPGSANYMADVAVKARVSAGDTAIAFFGPGENVTPAYNYLGCEARPSVADQQSFAVAIEGWLKAAAPNGLGWTAATWTP